MEGTRSRSPRALGGARLTTVIVAATALAAATGSCARLVAEEAAATPPNIVVFLSDDQGWGDLRVHGNTDMETPSIDSLARDGVRFDRFYVSPVCSPTRAEFLTGRHHPRGGVYSTSAGGERLDLDETTIAQVFRAAGYATGAFGKWHNGMQHPYHPNARGFDEFYGFCSGHWGNYFSPWLERNGEPVRGDGYIIDDLTGEAIEFIEAHRDGPFFVYLPYNTPHSPMQVPDEWWERYADRELEMHHRDPRKEDPLHQRAALAMCENIDANVGRVLRKLDELEIAERTIVVYFADNGPNGARWNADMRGRKGSTDEGGVRSPFFVRWPGHLDRGREVTMYGGAIDILPTLADLAGVEFEAPQPLDGISLAPLLRGEAPADPERLYFSTWNGRVSVRSGPYRLDHQGRLYDLEEDPGQRRDIAASKPEVAARLRGAVAEWRRDVLPERGPELRPFPVGHPGARTTQLPARDAKATGGIRRSNRFPNCSYFTDWTSTDDEITWDVDVLEGGSFDAEVWYACPEGDQGATIELALGDAKLRQTIAAAHDEPATGAEHDRIPRAESYVKDFAPLALGEIDLDRGPGTLTLRAVENSVGQVMEVRLLILRRRSDDEARR